MGPGSIQPLVKMSTRNISCGGKGGRCVRLTTSPPSSVECHEIWGPKPPGTLWATPGLLRDCFICTFTITTSHIVTSNSCSPRKGEDKLTIPVDIADNINSLKINVFWRTTPSCLLTLWRRNFLLNFSTPCI